MTREKRRDEFGDEERQKMKNRRARERPFDARARSESKNEISLDPKLLSVNEKESILRMWMWSERPFDAQSRSI